MRESDFDVIVIGSGCAGAIAAYVCAKQGKSVLVVERGETNGCKNMSGGRIYAHSLKKVFDTYSDGEITTSDIPYERKITHERINMLSEKSALTIDFTSDELGIDGQDSYAVLRGEFDQWLSEQAENAGAEYINGISVDELLKDENGAVIGIKAGDDEITGHVTIVAEGVNSLLTERFLGAPRPKRNQMAVGIKEVFELPAKEIESRFLCAEGEGAAMLYVGDATHGCVGGGFMYTNKESISLGLVATIENLSQSDTPIYQMLDDFKKHPAVAPLLRDAKLVEHSGHMVSEGGFNMIPQVVHDGALVAGDSAMLCMNLGYMVRGMDLAVASGQFAAEAACRAIDAQDVSVNGLASYKQALSDSFVFKDLETFKKWPHTMETWERMFTEYPAMVGEMFNAMFVVDGKPAKPLIKRMMPIIKKRGLLSLGKEVIKAVKSL